MEQRLTVLGFAYAQRRIAVSVRGALCNPACAVAFGVWKFGENFRCGHAALHALRSCRTASGKSARCIGREFNPPGLRVLDLRSRSLTYLLILPQSLPAARDHRMNREWLTEHPSPWPW